MKKTKKIKLHLEAEYNFILIGIVSSENDYTLSWAINRALNIALKKEKELEVIEKRTKLTKLFTQFAFSNEKTNYTLIANKSKNKYLIKEQSTIDFFLKIESESDLSSIIFTKKLKKEKAILATFNIPLHNLKSKDYLLF